MSILMVGSEYNHATGAVVGAVVEVVGLMEEVHPVQCSAQGRLRVWNRSGNDVPALRIRALSS